MSKKYMYTVNQVSMSLSTYFLEDGRDSTARLHCRCHHRCRVYMPTSNTASHDDHGKINSWVSFSFLLGMGLCLPALRATGAPLKITNFMAATDNYFSWVFPKIQFLNHANAKFQMGERLLASSYSHLSHLFIKTYRIRYKHNCSFFSN